MRRITAVASGEVQGVGYRWSLRVEAQRAGVGGWVRNRDDGTVEAELAGDDEAVARVLDWMRHGPAGAAVSDVAVTDLSPAAVSPRFDIRP